MVLLLEIHRVHGHDFLCPKEKEQSHFHSPCDPPWLHANVGLVRRQIHSWRPQHVLRPVEHIRAHRYVLVLLVGRSWTMDPTVSMVEEIPDRPSNGSIRPGDGSRVPASFHRLQLPESVRLVDRYACLHVLLPVPRLLHRGIQEEEIYGAAEEEGRRGEKTARKEWLGETQRCQRKRGDLREPIQNGHRLHLRQRSQEPSVYRQQGLQGIISGWER